MNLMNAVSARRKMLLVSLTVMLVIGTVAFGELRMNAVRYDSRTSHRLLQGRAFDEQNPERECIPLAFAVECSSDEISPGKPVECRFKSDAREDALIVVKWIVSRGASKRAQTGNRVNVWLTNPARAQIKVTVKVVSPKVCFFTTASKGLRVVKPTTKTDKKGR